jgi:hypothetical protein
LEAFVFLNSRLVYFIVLKTGGWNWNKLPDYKDFEKEWLGMLQPLRTDFEGVLENEPGVLITIDPV